MLYEPDYLAEVVDVLRAGPDEPRPSARRSPTATTVWVVATEKVLGREEHRRRSSARQLVELEQHRIVDRPFDVPERHRLASWCRRHDALPLHPTIRGWNRRRGTPSRSRARSAVRATRAGARQHARARRLLPLAAAARSGSATRCCSGCCSSPSCSTSCRRSGSGGRAWPAGAAAPDRAPLDRRAPAARRRVHPDLQRAGRDRRGDRRRRHADARRRRARRRPRRRRPRRDGADGDAPRRPLHPPAPSTTAPRPGTSTTPSAAPTPRSSSSSTATTCRTRDMLERLLPEFVDPRVRLRAVPAVLRQQRANRLAGAAWSQQALFFGPIARGKDAHRSMICCGTNVVFRRDGARRRRRLPDGLAHRGLRAVDRPPRAALGVGVRARAAGRRLRPRGPRGLHQPAAPLGARLPRRDPAACCGPGCRCARSCSTCCRRRTSCPGWTVALYLALPVIRIVTGIQPLAGAAGRHVPRRVRAVLRAVAGDRRQRRRRDVHVRRLLAGDVDVLAPRPRHVSRCSGASRRLRGHAQGGRLAAPAAPGGAGAGRHRRARGGRPSTGSPAAATRRR